MGNFDDYVRRMLADITFHVQDEDAQPLVALLDAGAGVWQAMTNEAGNFTAHLAPDTYHIDISAPGFETRHEVAVLADPGTVTFGLTRIASLLPRITRRGRDLYAGNDLHLIIGCTDLMLAWRYDMEGPDAIRPVLEQRNACGFNNLRVLWQKDIGNNGVKWLMPVEKIRPFVSLLETYLFYTQGNILADCKVTTPSLAEQQARVREVLQATAGMASHIPQLGNEYEKNDFDPHNFSKPTDRFSLNASSVEGGKDAPYWDAFVFSGQRSPLNHAIREYGPLEFIYSESGTWGGVPAWCDEGMKPGIASSDPRDWYRAGAQARSGNGGRYHSGAGTSGMSCLFNDLETACGEAFTRGIGS